MGQTPRTIGLLGGMSWESTALYYRLANELVRDRLGGLHSARIVLVSVDFAEIETLQAQGRWDEAGALLADRAMDVERGGADLLLLCTNTMHKVADTIQDAIGIPLVHLADVTATAVSARGLHRVGLLGTGFTMREGYYRDRVASHDLDVLVPSAADQELVHGVIYEELCRGIVRPESRDAFLGVIDRLQERGCEGIVLGCTEIELLIDPEAPSHVPLFATSRLHVQAGVELALRDLS